MTIFIQAWQGAISEHPANQSTVWTHILMNKAATWLRELDSLCSESVICSSVQTVVDLEHQAQELKIQVVS